MWRLFELFAVLLDGVKVGWQAADFGGRVKAWHELATGRVAID